MSSINQFVIIGNITKDVELRHTPGGTAVVTFIVAVNHEYFDRDDNKKEDVDFIPVTTYGKQAEADAKFLKKGSSVAVQGRIKSWYKAADKKGGFNFEAATVKYLGKPSGKSADADDAAPSPESEHFAREYEEAMEQERKDALNNAPQAKAPLRRTARR
jgi:single-strand DNA-binding protein